MPDTKCGEFSKPLFLNQMVYDGIEILARSQLATARIRIDRWRARALLAYFILVLQTAFC